MKRLFIFLVVTLMIFSLFACEKTDENNQSEQYETGEIQKQTEKETEKAEDTEEYHKKGIEAQAIDVFTKYLGFRDVWGAFHSIESAIPYVFVEYDLKSEYISDTQCKITLSGTFMPNAVGVTSYKKTGSLVVIVNIQNKSIDQTVSDDGIMEALNNYVILKNVPN